MATKGTSATIEGLKSAGVGIIDDTPTIESIMADRNLAKTAADEAFMHEIVMVVLHETTDVNAPPYATLNVNGDLAVVHRGRETRIKRKHLEVLARMKETRWVQSVADGYIGSIGAESLVGRTALAYPFQVIEDTNPKGMAWLRHILAEAA